MADTEEQGITPEQTSEEKDLDMETGKKDEDTYTEEGRENLVDDDEISAREQGFSEGAEGRGQDAKCAHCGKPLADEEENVIERNIKGENKRFCSSDCAEAGVQKTE